MKASVEFEPTEIEISLEDRPYPSVTMKGTIEFKSVKLDPRTHSSPVLHVRFPLDLDAWKDIILKLKEQANISIEEGGSLLAPEDREKFNPRGEGGVA